MASGLEQALLRGAHSLGYRNSVVAGTMPDTTQPHAGWSNDLINYVRVCEGTYGNAWKPGTKYPDMTITTFQKFRPALTLHLKQPINCYELEGTSPAVSVIVADGVMNPVNFIGQRKGISVCAETSGAHQIIASLLRSVAKSDFARQVGTVPPQEVYELSQGQLVLQFLASPPSDVRARF